MVGFVWLQGWNEQFNEKDGPTSAQMIAEYADNMVDMVNDIRAADSRIPDDLPAIIVESADQNAAINAQRLAAANTLNAANSGSAVFIEMNGLVDQNYGGLNASGSPFDNGWAACLSRRFRPPFRQRAYQATRRSQEPLFVRVLCGGKTRWSGTAVLNRDYLIGVGDIFFWRKLTARNNES